MPTFGCIKAVGPTPASKAKWVPYGLNVGKTPIWGPYRTRIVKNVGPIWVPYSTHMGLPLWDPCGNPCETHMGPMYFAGWDARRHSGETFYSNKSRRKIYMYQGIIYKFRCICPIRYLRLEMQAKDPPPYDTDLITLHLSHLQYVNL